MEIKFCTEGEVVSSKIYFTHSRHVGNIFITKNGYYPYLITINKDRTIWRMEYCHEIAHVMTASAFVYSHPFFGPRRDYPQMFRWETVSWKLAKSFCKKKYWNGAYAIHSLKDYAKDLLVKVDWKRFKIIELNKGIKL